MSEISHKMLKKKKDEANIVKHQLLNLSNKYMSIHDNQPNSVYI